MEEQSQSLIRRTRFCHSVYRSNLGPSSLDSIPFTLQPRRIPGSKPSSPDPATVNSRTRPTHVMQTQQTVSAISEPKEYSEDFNDAGSIPNHGLRKERKKGYFGKLLHKHYRNTNMTISSSSDSKSPSHDVSTFLKHVKSLMFRNPKNP